MGDRLPDWLVQGLTTEVLGAILVAVVTVIVWPRIRHRVPTSRVDRWLKRPPTEPDTAPWLEAVRAVMRQSWVAAGSPLAAVEKLREDLRLTADDSWMHERYRTAKNLANGETIDLADCDGAGGLWEVLDGSYLVVGEAGTGKSVLLWQTLKYLLDHTNHTPLHIEVFRWAEFDHTPQGPLPRFDDFVTWRLQDPAFATPEPIAQQLASDVVLLLDGLDELADLDNHKARRFLDSLAAAGNRINDRVVLTARPAQLTELIADRGSGTSVMDYSLVIEPYPLDLVVDLLERQEPPLRHVIDECERLPALGQLLGRPLWLALINELYAHQWSTSPFATLTNPTPTDLEQITYRAYLKQTATSKPEQWRAHVGFLASKMTTGAQTLTLQQIQGPWLPAHLQPRQRLVFGLVVGLVSGLGVGLVGGLVYGLGVGLVGGLVVGLVFGLIGGLGGEQYVVPRSRQRFDLRNFEAHASLGFGLVGGLGVGLGGGLVYGLGVGLVGGLAFGLLECFEPMPALRPTTTPSAAIRADTTNKLTEGLFFGLFFGLVAGLVGGLVYGLVGGLVYGLVDTVLARHLAARWFAFRAGLLPLRFGTFLDEMVKDGLMYRVGPGYRFRHRTLSQWIANEWHNDPVIDLTNQRATLRPRQTRH